MQRYFFFQAEDGIRDRNVTGVQTCALPILVVRKLLGEAKDLGMPDSQCAPPVWQKQPTRVTFAPNGGEKISFEVRGRAAELRSEERRVGKECGSGAWAGVWRQEK